MNLYYRFGFGIIMNPNLNFRSGSGLNWVQKVHEPDHDQFTSITSGTYCNFNFAFMIHMEGVIIACSFNAPRSWHDSCVAQPIYEKLLNDTPDGFYLVADTAFS